MDENDLAGDLTPDEPLEPEAAADQEPQAETESQAWAGPSREEWEASQQVLTRLGGLLSEADQYAQYGQQDPYGQYPQQQEAEYDPFDPESQAQFFGRLLDERLGPVQQWLGAQQAEASRVTIDTWLNEARDSLGGFQDERTTELARSRAPHHLPETVNPMVPHGDPRGALHRSAQWFADYEKALMQKGVDRYIAGLKGLQGAPSQPGPSGAATPATEVLSFDKGMDEIAYARQIAERRARGVA